MATSTGNSAINIDFILLVLVSSLGGASHYLLETRLAKDLIVEEFSIFCTCVAD